MTDIEQPEASLSASSALQSPLAGPHDHHFQADHLTTDLKHRTVRGGVVTAGVQAIKFVMHLTSTVMLARILDPTDFGLMSMVLTFTGLFALLRDFGLSQATVQRATITHNEVSTLFWLSLASSTVLAGLVVAIAPIACRFYSEPRLFRIALVAAATIVVSTASLQHQAILSRQLRYSTLAVVDLASSFVAFIVAVGIAMIHGGYWALVAAPLASALITTLVAWCAVPWRPGPPRHGLGLRELVQYGVGIQISRVAYHLITTLDNSVIGRTAGPGALGLYSRGYQLLTLPATFTTTAAYNLVIPTLSRLQHDKDRYSRFFSAAVEVTTSLTMPITALLLICAVDVVPLFLGPNWSSAAELLHLLGPAALVFPLLALPTWVSISIGASAKLSKWCVGFVPIYAAAFICGAYYGGVRGVAIGCSVASPLFFIVGLVYCLQGSPVGPSSVLRALKRPLISTLLASCIAVALTRILVPSSPLSRLTISTVGFSLVYAAASWVQQESRILVYSIARSLIRRR